MYLIDMVSRLMRLSMGGLPLDGYWRIGGLIRCWICLGWGLRRNLDREENKKLVSKGPGG